MSGRKVWPVKVALARLMVGFMVAYAQPSRGYDLWLFMVAFQEKSSMIASAMTL